MGLTRNDKPAGEAQIEEAEKADAPAPPTGDAAGSNSEKSIAAAAVAAKEAAKKAPEGHGKFRAVKIKIRDSESNVMYPVNYSVLGPRTDWVLSQLHAGILIEEK